MNNHSNTKTARCSNKALRVLFIASGNHGAVTPIVKNQGDALTSAGVQIDYYLIRGRGVLGYLRNVRPLRRYLHTHSYDAVHAHYSLSAFAASLAGAKPLIVSLMGSDVKAASWYKFIIRMFAFLFHWKSIIVKSADMYRSLGIKRAIVIPNGVNMNRFHPMDKTECQLRLGWTNNNLQKTNAARHILFPANAARPEKDYALAEAAVAALNRHLAMDDKPQTPKVLLHAFDNTPNEETPYWYNAADVVLMTSKWEGSPNAIKEAMACSRPIVATNVGDIAERMNGLDGCYVVSSRNPEELAQLIQQAVAHFSTHGRERIITDGLDTHSINQKLVKIYNV